MTRDVPSGAPAGAASPASWRPAERLALPAGWALALAARLPGLLASGPGERGPDVLSLGAALFWWAAVVAVVRSDLRDFIIPDEASLAIASLGVVTAVALPWMAGEGSDAVVAAALAALSTGAVAFAVFHGIGLLFRRFGRDALGFGDVKLAGACAVWLAPGDAALALEVAALGAIAALLLARRGVARGGGTLRDTAVPFGAFLAPAAWLVYVLAPPLRDALGALP